MKARKNVNKEAIKKASKNPRNALIKNESKKESKS